jgi:hypothetical protein
VVLLARKVFEMSQNRPPSPVRCWPPLPSARRALMLSLSLLIGTGWLRPFRHEDEGRGLLLAATGRRGRRARGTALTARS